MYIVDASPSWALEGSLSWSEDMHMFLLYAWNCSCHFFFWRFELGHFSSANSIATGHILGHPSNSCGTLQVFLFFVMVKHVMVVVLVYSWNYFLLLFLDFELRHFSNSNSIENGCLVGTTPPTAMDGSVWNFAGIFVMVWRYACAFVIVLI